jgi:bifunctional DNase/RNase
MLKWMGLLTGLCATIAVMASCASNSRPASSQVKVQVANVGVDKQGLPYVVLTDPSGDRVLPIMIGENEAQAIAMQLRGVNPGRPLTYDLIRNLLEATGNQVERVEVNDLRDQTYYATIFLDKGRYRVDARPSDAIAVALATHAPIYVEAKLFEAGTANVSDHGTVPPAVRGFGITVQELSPDIAGYFAAQPGSALLVADVSGPADSAGVARGDLITQVGQVQVHTLPDFTQGIERAKHNGRITLVIERNGHFHNVTMRAQRQ